MNTWEDQLRDVYQMRIERDLIMGDNAWTPGNVYEPKNAWERLTTAEKLEEWANQRQPWDKDDVTMATALLKQAAMELRQHDIRIKDVRTLLRGALYDLNLVKGKVELDVDGGSKGGFGDK